MTPEQFVQAVEEFKVIYFEEYGVKLSNEDATKKAKDLLQLFDCLIKDKGLQ